jgi:hypothetical protein
MDHLTSTAASPRVNEGTHARSIAIPWYCGLETPGSPPAIEAYAH